MDVSAQHFCSPGHSQSLALPEDPLPSEAPQGMKSGDTHRSPQRRPTGGAGHEPGFAKNTKYHTLIKRAKRLKTDI